MINDRERRTVVIAHPQPIVREGLAARLSEMKEFDVLYSTSSVAVLRERIRKVSPHILVVDFNMINASDTGFISPIQQMWPDTSLILLVDEDVPNEVSQARQCGATALVSKHSGIDDVVAAVRWVGKSDLSRSDGRVRSLGERVKRSEADVSRRTANSDMAHLTEREIEILELFVYGLSPREVAQRLNIAPNTVRTHTRNLQMKLHVHSNLEAVSLALEVGLRPRNKVSAS